MRSRSEYLVELRRILAAPPYQKMLLIKLFQTEVWDGEPFGESEVGQVISDFATDLEFYEPEETIRKTSPGLYGEERLQELLREIISKLS